MTTQTKLNIKKVRNAMVQLLSDQKLVTLGQIALVSGLTKREVSHAIKQDAGETIEIENNFPFKVYRLR